MSGRPNREDARGGQDEDPLEAAQRIVNRSGNNFHSKVARFFRDNDWNIMLSPYYVDPATDRAREIDLIAEKLFFVKHRHYEQHIGTIRLRLHIECKFIKQKTVFWFDGLDETQAKNWISRNTLFNTDERVAPRHHYSGAMANQVAKLFATDENKDVESDPIFKALNQCLNGLVNSRGAKPLAESPDHLTCLKTVEYPVIICSNFEGLFFRTRVVGPGDIETMEDNFLIEINYAYRGANSNTQREYFLVDVVDFRRLGTFISALETEIKHMVDIAKLRSGR